MFRYTALFTAVIIFSALNLFGQAETLNNETVIGMSRAGLSAEIISRKIVSAEPAFDVSVDGLIELKKAGVDDSIIALMMERTETALPRPRLAAVAGETSGTFPAGTADNGSHGRASVIASAKTIAFGKSSLQPSRQALEKELMRRQDFQKLNLTILRYKEQADLFVDIGYVSGSWLTHRYVFRIYDQRSGAVIAAGETTSWGSLAENLARHISKRLATARSGSRT